MRMIAAVAVVLAGCAGTSSARYSAGVGVMSEAAYADVRQTTRFGEREDRFAPVASAGRSAGAWTTELGVDYGAALFDPGFAWRVGARVAVDDDLHGRVGAVLVLLPCGRIIDRELSEGRQVIDASKWGVELSLTSIPALDAWLFTVAAAWDLSTWRSHGLFY